MSNRRKKMVSQSGRKWAILSVKLGIGCCLIAWLIRTGRFQPHVYAQVFNGHHWWKLVGILTGQCVTLLALFIRWWLLIRAQGVAVSFTDGFKLGLMGVFANLFIPGGLGLDGVRLLHVNRMYRGQLAEGTASVIVDRVLGIVALLVLGSACSLFILIQQQNHRAGFLMLLLLINGSLFVGLAVFLALVHGLPRLFLFRGLNRIRAVNQVVAALQDYRGRGHTLAASFVLSIVGHLSACVAICCALWSLNFEFSASGVLTATPIVTIARALPTTPLSLGVTDSVAALVYPMVGLQGGAEVQMLLRSTMLLLGLLCGLAYLRASPNGNGIPVDELEPPVSGDLTSK